ncbi:MAG TPA: hypothetical protein VEG44_02680 [Candidatus Acidoferrales bacterium]|nr:hypothetical protein [Candidatus Acidoferrales bacterium]
MGKCLKAYLELILPPLLYWPSYTRDPYHARRFICVEYGGFMGDSP